MVPGTENTNIFQVVLAAMRSAPIDLEGLSARLGVSVVRSELPDDISGSIELREDGGYLIRINARHPETRQRFTLAHELGHFVSHRHLLKAGTNDSKAYRTERSQANYNSDITQAHETEANRFAAALLMPEQLVKHFYDTLGRPGADKLAATFKVSQRAMEIRIDGLKRRGVIS